MTLLFTFAYIHFKSDHVLKGGVLNEAYYSNARMNRKFCFVSLP